MEVSQESRTEFLRNVKSALELLLLDCELIEDGFQFYDVVDFAAIYAFVYKQSSPPFIRLSGEPEERSFARRQLALQALFNIYPRPLLLIPPYQAELTNHLNYVYSIVGLGALDVRVLYREKLSRLVEQSEQFKTFLSIKSRGGTEPIDEQLQQAALKIARDYFPELYTSLAFLIDQNQEAFRALIRNNIVKFADEVLPECSDIDYSTERTTGWYKKINLNRSGKRALQSHTDAMACTYLEAANAQLNPKKKAVVFVSPSASVSAALSGSSFISFGSHIKIPVARQLTYCMLACLHKGDKTMIKDNLAMVGSLLELYDSPIRVEWHLQKRREQAALAWRRCENLLMASESSIMTEVKPNKRMADRDLLFLDVLLELRIAATSGEILQLKIDEELSALHQEMGELNKLIPAISVDKAKAIYRTIEIDRSIKVNQSDKSAFRIVFPGLSDELPMELTFTDKGMIRLARAFERLKLEGYPDEEILWFRKQILDSTGDENTSPEHHLLAGYILALEGRYSAALSELAAGGSKANELQQTELDLICALVHRKMGHGRDAVKLLERALRATGETRIHVEMARALTLMWRQKTDDDNGTRDLDLALIHLEEAIKSGGSALSPEARAQIENVAAFVCTEKALAEETSADLLLEEANRHISQMEELLPEERWVGRFFDTRGYWYYVNAALLENTPKEKLKALKTAERDIERALRCSENFAMGSNVRQKHLELVRHAISNLTVSIVSAELRG